MKKNKGKTWRASNYRLFLRHRKGAKPGRGRRAAAVKTNSAPAPFFSIILPTYNRAHLLSRAIESVLRQTFDAWELIIVDDGSTDGTKALVAQYAAPETRVRYVAHPHSGLASSRNLGLLRARGDFITFLDSDDEYLPSHLQTRLKFLLRHPQVEILHGGVQIVGDEYVADKFDPSRRIHLRACVIGGTLVVRSDFFLRHGKFPIVPYGDDAAFFDRAIENGAVIARIAAPTYIYRRGEPDALTTIAERSGIEGLRQFQHTAHK